METTETTELFEQSRFKLTQHTNVAIKSEIDNIRDLYYSVCKINEKIEKRLKDENIDTLQCDEAIGMIMLEDALDKMLKYYRY